MGDDMGGGEGKLRTQAQMGAETGVFAWVTAKKLKS